MLAKRPGTVRRGLRPHHGSNGNRFILFILFPPNPPPPTLYRVIGWCQFICTEPSSLEECNDLNPCVFLPFSPVGPVFKFPFSAGISFTIVVPRFPVKPYWWPILYSSASDHVVLSRKGELDAVLCSQREGGFGLVPSPVELWAFSIDDPKWPWLSLQSLLNNPQMACPECSYADDEGFHFYRNCGYKRRSIKVGEGGGGLQTRSLSGWSMKATSKLV